MPYIRDNDFSRIRELVETIEELAHKNGHSSTPDIRTIAARTLKVVGKYTVELEKEEEKVAGA